MNKDWELSQEAFDALLDWLDSDREQAALKYETIRRSLIKIFTGRGCVETSPTKPLTALPVNSMRSKRILAVIRHFISTALPTTFGWNT
jgi:hypothetical protein